MPAPAPSTISSISAPIGSEPTPAVERMRVTVSALLPPVLPSPTMRCAAVALTALVLLILPSAEAIGAQRSVDPRAASASQLRAAVGPKAIVSLDRRTGRPRLLARRDGFLTRESDRRPAEVALDFIRAHERALGIAADDLAGLELVRSYRFGDGAVHLQWQQTLRGIPLSGPGLTRERRRRRAPDQRHAALRART